jgi:antitoxin YefM
MRLPEKYFELTVQWTAPYSAIDWIFDSKNPLTRIKAYSILYLLEGGFMDAITYTNLRQNLKSYMDRVFNDRDSLIITRKNNENVVLMSIDEYNSFMETDYLLSNGTNAEHLQKSIDQHKSGKIKERELHEYE